MAGAGGRPLYGREALAALGLAQIGAAQWVGACPRCRVVAVFEVGPIVAGKTVRLTCPSECPLRRAGAE